MLLLEGTDPPYLLEHVGRPTEDRPFAIGRVCPARYLEYGAAVAPLLAKVGGRVLYQGRGDELLIGYAGWDMVVLVEYPSRRAFTEMVTSPEYRAIAHLRDEALSRSMLQATTRLR